MILLRAMVLVMLLAAVGSVRADERILSFDSEIAIAADGSLDVTETIAVRAEGTNIRRGIYRDFPTRYRDARGNRFSVDFEVISLQRNGRPEPFFTENRKNGVRVNFGNDDFLPVPGEFTYVLRYRTARQIGFFEAHDELYWNVTGSDWAFPIDRTSARIVLPQSVPVDALRTDDYTGATGSQASDAEVATAPGSAHWTLSRTLAPGEQLTVVLGFPKGIVTQPTQAQQLRWTLRDFAGPIFAGVAVMLMLVGYLVLWWRIGRDPKAGTIIPQYEPPDGHAPSGLRYLRQQMHDMTCLTADVVALGVARRLRIEREDDDRWSLHRESETRATGDVLPPQRALFDALFGKSRERIELKKENASTLSRASAAHAKALAAQYQPRYFSNNLGWTVLGILYVAAAFVIAAVLSRGYEPAVLISIGALIAMIAIVVAFALLLRRRTPEGRALLDRIEGFRRYLGVAERDDLARLRFAGDGAGEPSLDAARYQALLPYALALDVEKAWTARFTEAVGAAAVAQAAASAGWMVGSGFNAQHFSNLGTTLGKEFSSQIASAATPPGSSSGGGGGGFAGGGGGGGGGGGR